MAVKGAKLSNVSVSTYILNEDLKKEKKNDWVYWQTISRNGQRS